MFKCEIFNISVSYKDEDIGRFSNLHECTLKNLLLVTVVALFTAKMTNPEKAIYFLSLVSCSISKLKSQMLFTCKNFVCRFYVKKKFWWPGPRFILPANIYLFKVNNKSTRKRCEIFSKLTIKTPEWRQRLVLVFLLLTLKIFHTFF